MNPGNTMFSENIPGTKGYLLYVSTYPKCPEYVNLYRLGEIKGVKEMTIKRFLWRIMKMP